MRPPARAAPILERVPGQSIQSVPSVRRVPVALSIAGSDSGGGAGIQADLKAFARAGVHGTTAITAITVQNTVAVSAVQPIDPAIITGQIRAVAEDLGIDAVKIGMLGDVTTIEAVARALDELAPGTPFVHDPVMVAESGSRLLALEAVDALRRLIVARGTVITPNLAEARVLADDPELDGIELVRALHALGPRNVVVTGGHRDTGTDLFFDGTTLTGLPGERHHREGGLELEVEPRTGVAAIPHRRRQRNEGFDRDDLGQPRLDPRPPIGVVTRGGGRG